MKFLIAILDVVFFRAQDRQEFSEQYSEHLQKDMGIR